MEISKCCIALKNFIVFHFVSFHHVVFFWNKVARIMITVVIGCLAPDPLSKLFKIHLFWRTRVMVKLLGLPKKGGSSEGGVPGFPLVFHSYVGGGGELFLRVENRKANFLHIKQLWDNNKAQQFIRTKGWPRHMAQLAYGATKTPPLVKMVRKMNEKWIEDGSLESWGRGSNQGSQAEMGAWKVLWLALRNFMAL